MSRAYSVDLRQRVIEAVQGGLSAHQAAERYAVAYSTAVLWVRRLRQHGEWGPRKMGRPRGSLLDPHAEYLLALLEQTPDLTLAELAARLKRERQVQVGITALWNFLNQQGLTFKKKRRTPPNRNART